MTPQVARAFFQDQGYLVVEDLLDADELATAHAEIHRLHQRAAQLKAQDDAQAGSFQFEPFAAQREQNGLPVLRKIENTGQHSDFFGQLAAHPRLVAAVQNLLGPDLLLFRSTLMLKPAFHGSAHGLHQDSAYWPMEPPQLVTVSIALTEATPQNGCIRVIPQSHLDGLKDWGAIARQGDAPQTERTDVDLDAQIDVPLKAGSAVFFHSMMVHGSGANTTPQPRHTALYAYFSPAVRYVPKDGGPPTKTFRVISGLDGAAQHTLVAAAPA